MRKTSRFSREKENDKHIPCVLAKSKPTRYLRKNPQVIYIYVSHSLYIHTAVQNNDNLNQPTSNHSSAEYRQKMRFKSYMGYRYIHTCTSLLDILTNRHGGGRQQRKKPRHTAPPQASSTRAGEDVRIRGGTARAVPSVTQHRQQSSSIAQDPLRRTLSLQRLARPAVFGEHTYV